MSRDWINKPTGPHELTEDTIAFGHLTELFVEYHNSLKRIAADPQFSKLYTAADLDGRKLIERIQMLNGAVIKDRIKMNNDKRRRKEGDQG